MIKEIISNANIKAYLARIEVIIKEYLPKDMNDYFIIKERLEIIKKELKEELNIYEIIEENEKLYIVMDNNDKILSKVDKLILSDELDIKKEGIIQGHGRPITNYEMFDLFKMEKSMCKISCETMNGKIRKGSGFFCEININFPIKYALFTNNHILDESNIQIDNIIHLECLEYEQSFFIPFYIQKDIKITKERKVFTNKELDYTCIELFESDNISNYFKIDPKLFKYNKNNLKDNDIFILQFPYGNDLSFSYGKILSLKGNKIKHNASTDNGSSGSPIIRRSKENYIIGLHYGGIKNKEDVFKFNLATLFDSILDNIKEQNNEINCIYIPKKNDTEIYLLHDYNLNINNLTENYIKEYSEAKNINKKIFEENIEIYVNDKKIKFAFKYIIKDPIEIKVKFKFKKLLTNTSFMFSSCSSLRSIDLSSFNTTKVNNMNHMFNGCSSLETIDLSSFNTTNIKNMNGMFSGCSSLKSIDLSSFDTTNVKDLSWIFSGCSSLNSINLSSFDTTNVKDLSWIFSSCSSLKSIDLSSFDTTNVINMNSMFYGCSSLESIDLSSFNTINVNNMNDMFYNCSSLESINLCSFNTINVNNMSGMFSGCSSLKSIDLSSFNTINVDNMSYMFSHCSSLKSIDLSSFDTTNAYYLSYMFSFCSSLESINLSSFNTTNVNDMNHMFLGSSLKKENIKIKNNDDKLFIINEKDLE